MLYLTQAAGGAKLQIKRACFLQQARKIVFSTSIDCGIYNRIRIC